MVFSGSLFDVDAEDCFLAHGKWTSPPLQANPLNWLWSNPPVFKNLKQHLSLCQMSIVLQSKIFFLWKLMPHIQPFLSSFYLLCWHFSYHSWLRVLSKSKNPGKTRIVQTPAIHPPLSNLFFLKHLETWKQHKKTQQNTKKPPPPKKKNRVGAWPTSSLPSFSLIFWIFFNLTKPLKWSGVNPGVTVRDRVGAYRYTHYG